MNKFLLSYILVIVLSCSVNADENYLNGNRISDEVEGLPSAEGQFKSFFSDKLSIIKQEGAFKSGKKEGAWKTYNKGSWLIEEGTYKEGKKDGLWKYYYYVGVPMKEMEFKNDEQNGKYVYYDIIGRTIEEGSYKNGQKIGPWKYYDEDGKLKEEGSYSEAVISKENLSFEATFVTSIWNDLVKNNYIDETGKVSSSVRKLTEPSEMTLDPKLVAVSIEVFNVMKSNQMNFKDGVWKYYYPFGDILKEITFSKGTEDGIAKFYAGGKRVREEGNYKNGQKDGSWKTFDASGNLKKEGQWENGVWKWEKIY